MGLAVKGFKIIHLLELSTKPRGRYTLSVESDYDFLYLFLKRGKYNTYKEKKMGIECVGYERGRFLYGKRWCVPLNHCDLNILLGAFRFCFFFQRHCFMLTASWHLSAVECKIWILGYQMKKKSDSNKINEEINPLLWLLSIDIIRGNNDLGHDLSHIIICLFHVLLL